MSKDKWSRQPMLQGTLGTLVRSTLEQVGVFRDAIEQQAKNQRVWIDHALLQRRYREALSSLGEAVYQLAASGELGEIGEHPLVADVLHRLATLEAELDETKERTRHAAENARGFAERVAERAGFARTRPRESGEPRVWRPNHNDDDGTVAAAPSGRPPIRGRAAPSTGGIAFVDDVATDDDLVEFMHADDTKKEPR